MTTPATEAPKTETTTPPPSDYDAMAAVFDGLVTPDETKKVDPEEPTGEVDPAAAPKAEGTEPKAETKTPEQIEAEAAAATAEPAAEPAATTEPATTEPVAAAPTTEAVDWEARFKDLEAKITAPAPTPARQEPPAAPAKIYSPEEEAFMAKYAEDWPDIVKGEALKRRGEYNSLVNHIFTEFNRVYAPLIERGSLAADQVSEVTALGLIRQVHADYDDKMYDDVHKWADGLQGMQKKVAQTIMAEGDPQDVVDLISDYKSATGKKPKVTAGAAPAAATTTAAPAAKVTEISATAKKAAKALGVVDSKRSTATTNAADPDDFDSAWNEAVGSK